VNGARHDPEAAAALARLGDSWRGVDAAVVLGSGLSGAATFFGETARRPYAEIPELGSCRSAGHPGLLTQGRIGPARVAFFQGRRHFYEVGSMAWAGFTARLAAAMGARLLLLFAAVGGIAPELTVGQWLFVEDHLNLMGHNPLEGVTGPDGPAFVDLTRTYRSDLSAPIARAVAPLPLHRGVLAAFAGPTYETPAEVRMARTLGASAVGMSTVPEAVWGRLLGLDVVAFGRVANPAAGISDEPLRHEDVVRETAAGAEEAARLTRAALESWTAAEAGLGPAGSMR
jgi:purine-nucleoside phosphorylase